MTLQRLQAIAGGEPEILERAREFGIRQALGANPRAILTLVLTQGMRMAGIGVALGLASSVALTRYLQSLLFGVGAHDLSVYDGVTTLLLGVALTARYLPAARDARRSHRGTARLLMISPTVQRFALYVRAALDCRASIHCTHATRFGSDCRSRHIA